MPDEKALRPLTTALKALGARSGRRSRACAAVGTHELASADLRCTQAYRFLGEVWLAGG